LNKSAADIRKKYIGCFFYVKLTNNVKLGTPPSSVEKEKMSTK